MALQQLPPCIQNSLFSFGMQVSGAFFFIKNSVLGTMGSSQVTMGPAKLHIRHNVTAPVILLILGAHLTVQRGLSR